MECKEGYVFDLTTEMCSQNILQCGYRKISEKGKEQVILQSNDNVQQQ